MYHRVTKGERRAIYFMRQEGDGIRMIARRLGRSAGTISRELRRNKGRKGYRYKQADARARTRATRVVPRRFTPEMMAEVARCLRYKGATPQIISAQARKQGRAFVCKETIYQHLYAEGRAGGALWRCLPRAHRQRRRRCPRDDGRGQGRLRNQRRIDERPDEVAARATFGHWEGDLINGAPGTGHLVTLVERKTRFALIGRTQTKEAKEVARAILRLFAELPSRARRSLTLDNGKEFAGHETIAKRLKMGVFFAHPYHSWERGTNENVNGLIRREYPKRSSFAGIDGYQLWQLRRFVNDRARECLGWNTPGEEIAACLGFAP